MTSTWRWRVWQLASGGVLLALLAACSALSAGADSGHRPPGLSADASLEATPTYGLAGQSASIQLTALAIQQTQADLQVRMIEATAQARQTIDARDAIGTQSAATSQARLAELQFQSTAGAATHAARETELAFNMTLRAATSAVQSTRAAAVATAQMAEEQARAAKEDEMLWRWLSGLSFTAVVLVALWYLVRIGRGLAGRADPQQDPQRVRVLRLPMGTLVITPTVGGGLHRELLALPAAPGFAPTVDGLDEAQFETDEEVVPEPEDAPMYRGGVLSGYYNRQQAGRVRAEDDEHRKFMLWFLRRCMEVAGRNGSTIPPHDKLRIATETWSKATDMIASQIEKKRGRYGGTRLVGEYATLMALWLAVGERRFVPRPSSRRAVVEGTVHVPPSPVEVDSDPVL